MKKSIWKFPLKGTGRQTISMPENATILTLEMQHGVPCIWAEVDEDATPVERFVTTFGTGTAISPDSGTYVGTYQLHNGDLVFHVYID